MKFVGIWIISNKHKPNTDFFPLLIIWPLNTTIANLVICL